VPVATRVGGQGPGTGERHGMARAARFARQDAGVEQGRWGIGGSSGAVTRGPRGGEEERGRERAADTWADRARVAVMGWRVGSTGPAR
jgi:hypothetical protein